MRRLSQWWCSLLLVDACGPMEPVVDPPGSKDGVSQQSMAQGARDEADRGCAVVLRQLAAGEAPSGAETDCRSGTCFFVWRGVLDVSLSLQGEGAVPYVTFHSTWYPGEWWVVPASTIDGAPAGYARYQFALDHNTAPAGASDSSLARTQLEVAPYALTPSGGRVFDHNRHRGDYENYVLAADNGWRVEPAGDVCP